MEKEREREKEWAFVKFRISWFKCYYLTGHAGKQSRKQPLFICLTLCLFICLTYNQFIEFKLLGNH